MNDKWCANFYIRKLLIVETEEISQEMAGHYYTSYDCC